MDTWKESIWIWTFVSVGIVLRSLSTWLVVLVNFVRSEDVHLHACQHTILRDTVTLSSIMTLLLSVRTQNRLPIDGELTSAWSSQGASSSLHDAHCAGTYTHDLYVVEAISHSPAILPIVVLSHLFCEIC
ncbi:hypothetical protein FB567DRAFT_147512 [Paraphoma chrysanthemicola]|uniref:Uncharacterized protein n=1 Tax=Paraphoma chrysanthemicola TaxID=798071 RepID=A0A8K0QYQ8_9PLEO|nr:hypothetical protein FB567DRAFT_147512 [Paraphoma chrysanthemicola]